MFLDDELEQIYKENGFCEKTSMKLLNVVFNRMPKQEDALRMQPEHFLNKLTIYSEIAVTIPFLIYMYLLLL